MNTFSSKMIIIGISAAIATLLMLSLSAIYDFSFVLAVIVALVLNVLVFGLCTMILRLLYKK